MRGLRVGIHGSLALCLAPLLVVSSAWADSSEYYGAAETLCRITDPTIDELSGLVVLPSGELLLSEDSTQELPGSIAVLMYRLGSDCVVRGSGPTEFAQDPRDVEDLAFRDNMLWFADLGDNGADRQNVAVITVAYDPSDPQTQPKPQVYRFSYPDGPHDAEAFLLPPNGTPYIVTKELDGRAGVYRPGAPLDANGEVALVKVADVDFEVTGTPGGPVGRAGQVLVTGGAVSADGKFMALRTYTDAYVWPLTASDVPAAVGEPPLAVVPLPDAPQGEAISFAADSRSLMVGSEGVGSVITLIPASDFLNQSPGAPADPAEPVASIGSGAVQPGTELDPVSGLVGVAGILAVIWVIRRLLRRKPGSGVHGH